MGKGVFSESNPQIFFHRQYLGQKTFFSEAKCISSKFGNILFVPTTEHYQTKHNKITIINKPSCF